MHSAPELHFEKHCPRRGAFLALYCRSNRMFMFSLNVYREHHLRFLNFCSNMELLFFIVLLLNLLEFLDFFKTEL